uniref:Uncharacterized protein n=1 Tax=Attheya septentrionalis TaxID=420275 RepID=A0A7S2UQM9_9STRA|mmetsp:Transcript_5618/g.9887  ORF Transcript_5618/g.9887 Transcript_5618/m.9887 type:complete len:300 (+) Transcript_5618:180-1079(+)
MKTYQRRRGSSSDDSGSSYSLANSGDEDIQDLSSSESEGYLPVRKTKRKQKCLLSKRQRRRVLDDAPEKNSCAVSQNNSTETMGPKFQDDGTGRKPVNPSALRFVMAVIPNEVKHITEQVSEELTQAGDLEESRKVKVRTEHHITTIMTSVRRRMTHTKVPEHYIKIEDSVTDDLATMNERRKCEIKAHRVVAEKLRSQIDDIQQELEEAKEKNEELIAVQKKKNDAEDDGESTCNGSTVHPLLTNILSKKDIIENNVVAQPFAPNQIGISAIAPAPSDAIRNLIQNASSAYGVGDLIC